MAFNPFVSFRKYQKFWMASLVLMSMLTFVLCQGLGQGGLEDRILRMFRLNQGSALAKLNGRDIYSVELNELKIQRDIANEFMRKFCDYLLKLSNDALKNAGDRGVDEKSRQQIAFQAARLRDEFGSRLKKPRYWDSGTKLEELVDFKLWQAEADRLQIHLDDRAVEALVDSEMAQTFTRYTSDDSRRVMLEVRRNHQNANDTYILHAVREEFRVRLAQLSVIACQLEVFQTERLPVPLPHKALEPRTVVTPSQLWDFFKEKRAEFDVALVPIDVEKLMGKVDPPSEQNLKGLFETYKRKRYDPTSDEPGFEIPQQIKVEWVTADPASPAYKDLARVMAMLEVYPPPVATTLLPALRYELAPLAEKAAYRVRYESDAEGFLSPYRNAPLTSASFLGGIMDYQTKNDPAALKDFEAKHHPAPLAGMLAALAGSQEKLTAGLTLRLRIEAKYASEHPERVRAEVKKRLPLYAGTVGLAFQGVLPAAAKWYAYAQKREDLPLDIVLPQYKERHERSLAHGFVAHTMVTLRGLLLDSHVQGKGPAIENTLADMAKQLPFERHVTKNYYDRFRLKGAEELKPLRRGYERYYDDLNLAEGRAGTDRKLKEDDFDRMFFGGERFASTTKYLVRAWPPIAEPPSATDLTLINPEDFVDPRVRKLAEERRLDQLRNVQSARSSDLFAAAEKPILFWKADDKPSRYPDKLDEVRGDVDKAWKLTKAREKLALPLAGEIAKRLQQPGQNADLDGEAKAEAKKLGQERIRLSRIAPLYAASIDDLRNNRYVSYKLDKELFQNQYPRDDMVQNLLAFGKPQKAIEINNKELDGLNSQLFETYKSNKEGRPFVQVLTNQPRTMFYVGVLVKAPMADPVDFQDSFLHAFGHDSVLQRAYESIGKDARETILGQIRERMGWEIKADKEERKRFDSDSPG